MADDDADKTKLKSVEAVVFLVLALGLCAAMFGDALWGRSILAPVDIPGATWTHYRYMGSPPIPRNHHVIDQITYDLPLQWTIYHAWRRGEIPWWDPFTFGGRPLLADSHVSATDPVRVLCSLALPRFELAYNWTALVHSLIAGVGLWALLRRWGISAPIAILIGLLGLCTGANQLFLSHPWLPATVAFYPWLWLSWHRHWETPGTPSTIAAPLLAAAAIYAGNLQSHLYLLFFGLAFCAGYAGRDAIAWRHALGIVVPTGLIAALLAAPVLLPAIELLRLNVRPLGQSGYHLSENLLLTAAVWPWSTGTFRTLSRSSAGFHLFIGSAAFLLAMAGALRARLPGACRCAVILLAGFLCIMLIPPLAMLLYARLAVVATIGAIVLAAWGAEKLRAHPAPWRRAACATAALTVLIAVGTVAAIYWAYPRFKPRLLAMMEAHAYSEWPDGRSLPLRRFQVENYPREVGFTNPEVLAAWLSLAALAALFAVPRWRRWGVPALLALNLFSPALFTRRFSARASIGQWERLLAGGTLQQEARSLLGARGLRLVDRGSFDALFPATVAHLYGVHVVHGYAALYPQNRAGSDAVRADVSFDGRRFAVLRPMGDARYSWIGEPMREVTIVGESLNSITLQIEDGPAGWLLRTDTLYPGWRAFSPTNHPLEMQAEDRLLSKISIPAGPVEIRLVYRPTYHVLSLWLAAAGMFALAAWITAVKRTRRLSTSAPTL